MNAETDLEAWLCDDDERSRTFRAKRLRLVADEYGTGSGRMFYGGPISAWAFEEARRAYVYGLDLACIMMSQVCVEHSLHGEFKVAGRDDLDRATFKTLLREALKERLLSAEQYHTFERLRVSRNPYAHPRDVLDKAGLVKRSVSVHMAPDDLVADDAKEAIVALLRLTSRPPFALA